MIGPSLNGHTCCAASTSKKNSCPGGAVYRASTIAGTCDVMLVWEGALISVFRAEIRVEQPRIIGQPKLALGAAAPLAL